MQEAIAIQRELANRFTDVAVYGNVLRISLLRLSEIQEHLGKSEKAKETNELAEKELRRLKENVKRPKSFWPLREMPRDRPLK